MKNANRYITFLFVVLFLGCSKDNSVEINSSSLSDELTGGSTLFPLVENPDFKRVDEITLSDSDLVGIVNFGNQIRVYPYTHTNHSEVINDTYLGNRFAFTYCPITKSALAFNTTTNFKASGHLLRDNLVPWDEETETLWSQMFIKGIQGTKENVRLNTIPVVETRWSIVKQYFPNAMVLPNISVTNRNPPTGGGNDNSNDPSAPSTGDFVYGILNDFGNIYIFNYSDFRASNRIDVVIRGEKFIVYGDESKRIINAFKVNDFTNYELIQGEFPYILKSKSGIEYNIFGVSRNGASLPKPKYAYVAIWRAWDAFYDNFTYVD